MPKVSSDYRAVRAVLSAPYPLPIVITRNASGRTTTPVPQPTPRPVALCSPIETYYGFPVFNTRWRELPPAILPVPYPRTDTPKRRTWTVKLKRAVQREAEESEVELMSDIQAKPSRETGIIKQLSQVSLGQLHRSFTEVLSFLSEMTIRADLIDFRINLPDRPSSTPSFNPLCPSASHGNLLPLKSHVSHLRSQPSRDRSLHLTSNT